MSTSKFVKKFNEISKQQETNFPAKLISVAAAPKENVNKTLYRAVTIEFVDDNNVTQRTGGIMYEKNYQNGVKPGETYLATATDTGSGNTLITVSHLPGNGVRATASMFGFEATPVAAPTKQSTPALADA